MRTDYKHERSLSVLEIKATRYIFIAPPLLNLPHIVTSCHFTKKYSVYVFNNLPPQSLLMLHCASKDDDLGNHTLTYSREFDWEFCDSLFGNTLFFCTLGWGSKKQSFDVFNSKWGKRECDGGASFWLAKSDGIYFQNLNEQAFKKYDWQ
ncbi:S-protein homolog 2-like [Olea europaea var. sylvestris]|uniref:S-protein homolog 2-like n=1 Tax=Olea europaea var. sylvestris TaxID=158386 RepID=UPI000C1D7BBC|nr:S-protein homolog 2-like [Olea europaea var. sylvestris]